MTSTHGAAAVHTATLVGTHAVPVTVEVDIGPGLPAFIIVGLGDAAVLEARDRIRSALRASGFRFPGARVVVNLAPAPLRKHGTGFDLPIAAAILCATGQVGRWVADGHLVGELSLDGRIRVVPGLLAHAVAARDDDRWLCMSVEGRGVTGIVSGLEARPVERLAELRDSLPAHLETPPPDEHAAVQPDFADVAGHDAAKRALEIAAAGGHNVLMVGPPGSGKSMLAMRFAGLLPPLENDRRLESAVIHDIAGLDPGRIIGGTRAFRCPHHSVSLTGLVGGGSPPRPGEISLAHNGVLFLDELTEFGPAALQSLRQPLEDGAITLVRAEGRIRFPARFTLIAAANPCPCGFLGDPVKPCNCPPNSISRFRTRIGGPLLDRIDMRLRVDRIDPDRIMEGTPRESSATVRTRVLNARDRALAWGRPPASHLSGAELLAACSLSSSARTLLSEQARRLSLSGRGITRLLRVARTIADLDADSSVGEDALLEAIGYRGECP